MAASEAFSAFRDTPAFVATGKVRNWWRGNTKVNRDLARILFVVMVVGYFILFERRVWLRHEYFGTFDYDLGMYDQGIWQLSRGRGFMTVRGMHIFGHHANIGYLLFVPFYWLGAGPQFLNILNTAAIVSVTIPLYALCRTHMKSEWAGFWISFAYLGHYVPQWMIKETFHAESFAAPFIVGAFYFASVKNWRAYGFCVLGAIVWKEDIALAVAMLGIAVAVGFWEPKVGALTSLFAVVWFLASTKLLMAPLSPSAVYDTLFGPLGNSATEVARNSITNPSLLGDALDNSGAADRGVNLLKTYGFVPALSPDVLLIGLPQYLINSATTVNFTWDLRNHYNLMPFIGVILGATFAVIRQTRSWIAWLLVSLMVIGVFNYHEEGLGPWSANYSLGQWPLHAHDDQKALEEGLSRIQDDSSVSTMYYLVPHLSHRERVYTFPNPWIESNYGVRGVPAPPSTDTIDQLLIDSSKLNERDAAVFEEVKQDPDWELVWNDGTVVLYERTG